MNWEVPNMRSKTSLFNGSIFRSNFSRFWPIWGAYLVLLLITVPTSFTRQLQSMINSGNGYVSDMELCVDFLRGGHTVGLIFIAIFSVLTAMAVYSFMYSPRTTGLVASLPVKREGVFLTSWLSGYLWLAAAQIITAFVTILITAALGRSTAVYVLLWLAIQLLETLCFYGLASLCAVLTGTLYILPAIYVIFNFLFPVAEILIRTILEPFVLGMTDRSNISLAFLSPAIKLFEAVDFERIVRDGTESFTMSGMPAVAIYAAAGIVMSVGALLIYRRRRMETASDIVAINVLKPVFRYCMAFGFSITLGIVIYRLIFGGFSAPYDGVTSESILPLIISMLVSGFIGYFAAEMMIRKSFKVFDKWPGFVVFAVVVIALLLAVDADLFGYERFVPETEKVDSAYVSIQGNSVTVEDPGQIDALRSLHSSIIEDAGEQADLPTSNLYIQYSLRNGRTVSRMYGIQGNAMKLTEDFFNRSDILTERNVFDFPITAKTVYYSSVEIYSDDTGYYTGFDLTPRQTEEFYNSCLLPDLQEGKLGKIELYSIPVSTEKSPDTITYRVSIVAMEDTGPGSSITKGEEKLFYVTSEADRSFRYLEQAAKLADVYEGVILG